MKFIINSFVYSEFSDSLSIQILTRPYGVNSNQNPKKSNGGEPSSSDTKEFLQCPIGLPQKLPQI